jgi:Cdc6-related protein, AAA superfamily ATPase
VGEPVSPFSEGLEGLPVNGLALLVAKGEAQGSLTTGDVFDALSDVEPSPEQLERIYDYIRSQGVDLVDEIAAELAAEAAGDLEAVAALDPIPVAPPAVTEPPRDTNQTAAAPSPLPAPPVPARTRSRPEASEPSDVAARPDRLGEAVCRTRCGCT